MGKEHGANIEKNENELLLGNSSFPVGQTIPARLETKIEWIDMFSLAHDIERPSFGVRKG